MTVSRSVVSYFILSNAWSHRWRTDRKAEWELSVRHTHKGGDPSSETSQLVVPLGAEILRKVCWPAPSGG